MAKDYKPLYREAQIKIKKLTLDNNELRQVNQELNLMHHDMTMRVLRLRNEMQNKNKTSPKKIGKKSIKRTEDQGANANQNTMGESVKHMEKKI